MAFAGWLLKCGGVEIPMEWMQYETYSVTPSQRLDVGAERDMAGILHRDVAAHMPVKIAFTTPPLKHQQVGRINAILRQAYSDARSRTLEVAYYDPEMDAYKTALCYMPDTEYKIAHLDVEKKEIYYAPLRYAFIEY